jgi:hypothetical protein
MDTNGNRWGVKFTNKNRKYINLWAEKKTIGYIDFKSM